jgi:hypothetical protein
VSDQQLRWPPRSIAVLFDHTHIAHVQAWRGGLIKRILGVAMPDNVHLAEAVEGQGRIVGVGRQSLIHPTRSGVGRIMDTAVVAGSVNVFNISKVLDSIVSDQQTWPLINIDAEKCARPHWRGAGCLNGSPNA